MKNVERTKGQRVMELVKTHRRPAQLKVASIAREQAEERLSKINACFLSFGQDATENINRLTALCGELLGATCALYNRLDNGMLCSTGRWQAPPDYNPVDKPDGHICYDVIRRGDDGVFVVRNLLQTPYAQTDPNVIPYGLQTYVGKAVKCENAYVGSLCAVFQEDFVPSDEDQKLMSIIGSAVGVEEERRRAQEELTRYRDHLEELVNERTVQLSQANRQLQKEINERTRVEEALRASEERYRLLVENASEAISLIDRDGRFLILNNAAARILGGQTDDFVGKTVWDVLPKEVADERMASAKQIMQTGQGHIIDICILIQGEMRWFRQSTQPIRESSGQATTVLSLSADITEHKQAEEALRKSEEQYRQSVENSPNPIFTVDREGRIQTWNRACERVLQYGQDILGQKYVKLLANPNELSTIESMLARVFQKQSLSDIDIAYRCRDSTERFMVSRLYPLLDHEGNVQGGVFANTDISERVRAQTQIEASLHEKEVLLREIHHRVKNNLQVISSLLNLQFDTIQDPQALQAFRESQNRVRAMALVHERLYRSPNLAGVDMAEYIQSEIAYLSRAYGVSTCAITLNVAVDDVTLAIDAAIPVGLIINELVSNALKYAFSRERDTAKRNGSEIRVELGRKDHDQYTLVVSDNGVGLPQDVDLHDSPSLGLQLVNILTQQLQGTLEVDRSAGTAFKITFTE